VFFSSRRRHTRSKRDWSSDVCSSDLFQSVHLPYFRCLPVCHFISWKESGHMKGDIRIYGGNPFGLLFHLFLRIILSRKDQGGQFHVTGLCASSYKSFHRLQVASQLPVIRRSAEADRKSTSLKSSHVWI